MFIAERNLWISALVYLCATVLLLLGLSPENPFWKGQAEWTAQRAWSGKYTEIDHALD